MEDSRSIFGFRDDCYKSWEDVLVYVFRWMILLFVRQQSFSHFIRKAMTVFFLWRMDYTLRLQPYHQTATLPSHIMLYIFQLFEYLKTFCIISIYILLTARRSLILQCIIWVLMHIHDCHFELLLVKIFS